MYRYSCLIFGKAERVPLQERNKKTWGRIYGSTGTAQLSDFESEISPQKCNFCSIVYHRAVIAACGSEENS